MMRALALSFCLFSTLFWVGCGDNDVDPVQAYNPYTLSCRAIGIGDSTFTDTRIHFDSQHHPIRITQLYQLNPGDSVFTEIIYEGEHVTAIQHSTFPVNYDSTVGIVVNGLVQSSKRYRLGYYSHTLFEMDSTVYTYDAAGLPATMNVKSVYHTLPDTITDKAVYTVAFNKQGGNISSIDVEFYTLPFAIPDRARQDFIKHMEFSYDAAQATSTKFNPLLDDFFTTLPGHSLFFGKKIPGSLTLDVINGLNQTQSLSADIEYTVNSQGYPTKIWRNTIGTSIETGYYYTYTCN